MKLLALDIGDRWTGVAVSDELRMFARPHSTLKTEELLEKLQEIVERESISTIVVGLPITLRGRESDQTRKVKELTDRLKESISGPEWVYWDERLTSKHASHIKKVKTKEDKLQSHAIAAALFLEPYLEYRRMIDNESLD